MAIFSARRGIGIACRGRGSVGFATKAASDTWRSVRRWAGGPYCISLVSRQSLSSRRHVSATVRRRKIPWSHFGSFRTGPDHRSARFALRENGRCHYIADRTVAAVASASPGCRKGNLHMFAQNCQIGNQSINKCCSCVLGVFLSLSVMSGHVLGQLAPGVEEGDLFAGARPSA